MPPASESGKLPAMLREELVEGYVRGDITRRTFVRRLTATGVGLAAALSYAELIRPQDAHAAPGEDDTTEVEILDPLSDNLHSVDDTVNAAPRRAVRAPGRRYAGPCRRRADDVRRERRCERCR